MTHAYFENVLIFSSHSHQSIFRKYIFVGGLGIGKRSLLSTLSSGSFQPEHIQQFSRWDQHVIDKIVVDGKEEVKIALWDTMGHDDYDRLRPLAYPQTDAFFICFALDDVRSFVECEQKWLPEIQHHAHHSLGENGPNIPIVLIGLRSDLPHAISTEHIHELAQQCGALEYYEVSAREQSHEELMRVMEEVTRYTVRGELTSNRNPNTASATSLRSSASAVQLNGTNSNSNNPNGGGPSEDVDYIAELLDELDDRAACDDEQLWLNYESLQVSSGRAIDPSLSPFADEADPSVTPGTRPISAALRAAVPTPTAKEMFPRAIPAAKRTPLTPAQLAIAAELVVLKNHVTPATATATSRPPTSNNFTNSSTSTPPSFSSVCITLVHPLWISHGKKMFEQLQNSKLDELTRAPTVEHAVVAVEIEVPQMQSSPSPLSSATGSNSSTLQRKSSALSSTRGSSRGVGPTVENTITPVQPPPTPFVNTLAFGKAVLEARDQRVQDAIHAARYIPLSKVTPVPLMPDSEYWHLRIERGVMPTANNSPTATHGSCIGANGEMLQLRWSNHSLTLLRMSQSISQSRSLIYSFDGQQFRESFEEGHEEPTLGGVLEDRSRCDWKVWEQAKATIEHDLLHPLGLESGRVGWRKLIEEYIPFPTCGIYIQPIRSFFDLDLINHARPTTPASTTTATSAR